MKITNQLYILLLLMLNSFIVTAQSDDYKRDYQWILGYDYWGETPGIDGTLIDFNTNPIQIKYIFKPFETDESNSEICDKNGKILFYANGCNIADSTHHIMKNGNNINPGLIHNALCVNGNDYVIGQGMLSIPVPNKESFYYLFHKKVNYYDSIKAGLSDTMYYSLIDMSKNNGKGAVIKKNQVIIPYLTAYGRLTAVRHANGRDWWLLTPHYIQNKYTRFLVTPDSISSLKQQIIGINTQNAPKYKGFGQACFSPNGKKYARREWQDGVLLYDFDRSTGLLSNFKQLVLPDKGQQGGISFSPNSRFLYAASDTFVYQFDLHALDVEGSRQVVATWDGFADPVHPFDTRFFLMQLAPDCRIYISTSGTTFYLNVIDSPNKAGVACNVKQHTLKMPTKNAWGLPNYPNFRLGKEGEYISPCDSTIAFPVATDEVFEEKVVASVFPNPVTERYINLDLQSTPAFKTGRWELYSTTGQRVASYPLLPGHSEYRFALEDLADGLYIYTLKLDGRVVQSGKVVVMGE